MKVFGIDPGTARVGWAIVEKQKGNPHLRSYGCITTPKEESVEKRLLQIFTEITELIKKSKPDVITIEDLFFTKNAKTAITVAQARGVLLLAAAQKRIPIASYSPLAIKRAVVGYGKAEKQQVQKMVQQILKLSEIPQPDDAADAVAIALTHCFTKKF